MIKDHVISYDTNKCFSVQDSNKCFKRTKTIIKFKLLRNLCLKNDTFNHLRDNSHFNL